MRCHGCVYTVSQVADTVWLLYCAQLHTLSQPLALSSVHTHFTQPTVPDNATHARSVILYKSRAVLALTRAFAGVPTGRLLRALGALVKPSGGALAYFRGRPAVAPALPPGGEFAAPDDAPLKTGQVCAVYLKSLCAVQCYVACAWHSVTHSSLAHSSPAHPSPAHPSPGPRCMTSSRRSCWRHPVTTSSSTRVTHSGARRG